MGQINRTTAMAKELLRAIVDTSPFATMAFDAEGRLVLWSAAAARSFGWEADEVLGQPFPPEAIPPEERASSSRRIARTLAGTPVEGERVRRLTRDGRELILEIYGAAVRDRNGNAIGYAGQMIDVTVRDELAADLVLEARLRSALAAAVQTLAPESPFEDAAQVICDQLRGLPGVDFAAVGIFVDDDRALLLASNAPKGFPIHPGDELPLHRAIRIRDRSAAGPWAEYWKSEPEDGTWGKLLDICGLKAFAFGPIVHGDHADGGVVIGTLDAGFARMLVEKMPSAVDFSTTPSALIAERLHLRRDEIMRRQVITTALADKAFDIVYQPIVSLAAGEVVGHEALTRFHSGERPDLAFAAAWAVGIGAEMELATLAAAVEGARALPAGRWLNLNASPRLFDRLPALRNVLLRADRPVVLEITEHEIVADYGVIRRAVRSLGDHIRLAVDDAGAGVANFGHIIELGPDFVKLDTSVVRGVNANLGRQALVVGMGHFARTAGCRLVAEGIETEEEARTLIELGVEFGQGYLFGRPVPAPEQT
jgi:PAS domain S-box-containing protein